MPRRTRRRNPPQPMPKTRMAGQKPADAPKKTPVPKPPEDPTVVGLALDVDRLLQWVASATQNESIGRYYALGNAALVRLGATLDKKAAPPLGKPGELPNLNGEQVVNWLKHAGKDQLPNLQKVTAAMRHRIRTLKRAKR